MHFALVAQWIEHPPPKGRVTGSTPVEGATFYMCPARLAFLSAQNYRDFIAIYFFEQTYL